MGSISLCDKMGRWKAILISDVFYFLGALVMWFSPDIYFLFIGRFIVGLGIGISSMATPIYLSEVSPSNYRGMTVNTYVLGVAAGQFLSVFICLPLMPYWRVMLGVAALPPIVQALGLLYIPDSPRWLLRNKKEEMARRALF